MRFDLGCGLVWFGIVYGTLVSNQQKVAFTRNQVCEQAVNARHLIWDIVENGVRNQLRLHVQ